MVQTVYAVSQDCLSGQRRQLDKIFMQSDTQCIKKCKLFRNGHRDTLSTNLKRFSRRRTNCLGI